MQVTEFCEGGDLSEYLFLSNVPMDTGKKLDFACQVCNAVAMMHSRNFVHHDLKPQNMLLNRDQTVLKVCDLGIGQFTKERGKYPARLRPGGGGQARRWLVTQRQWCLVLQLEL